MISRRKNYVQINTEDLKEKAREKQANDIIKMAKKNGYTDCEVDKKNKRVRIKGNTFTISGPTEYNYNVRLINDTKKYHENNKKNTEDENKKKDQNLLLKKIVNLFFGYTETDRTILKHNLQGKTVTRFDLLNSASEKKPQKQIGS